MGIVLYIDLVVNVYIIPIIYDYYRYRYLCRITFISYLHYSLSYYGIIKLLYKISVDTVLLLCYTRMRVIYIIMCIVLSSSAISWLVVLLQIVTFFYILSLDKDSRQGHNGNHGKAITPDHPAGQASYREGCPG